MGDLRFRVLPVNGSFDFLGMVAPSEMTISCSEVIHRIDGDFNETIEFIGAVIVEQTIGEGGNRRWVS